MTADRPLPGSVDDYEMRARLRRLVARGGVAASADEARIVIGLAHQELIKLPRRARLMLVGSIVILVLGVIQLAWGDSLIAAISLVLAVASAIGNFAVQRLLAVRLTRAVRLKQDQIAAAE